MLIRTSRLKAVLVLVILGTVVMVAGACAGDDGGSANVEELNTQQREKAESLGLDPDQPYAGTELNLLGCCQEVPQYANLNDLTTEEFTQLTGIEVTWGNEPYGSFQQTVANEASTGAGAYDLVMWMDAWGPSIRSSLVPLDDKLEQANRGMDSYPEPYQQAATAGSEDGTTYGMPLRGIPLMFYYRQDVYDQLDLEPPDTYQEFVEQGQQINQGTNLDPTAMYYGRTSGQNTFLWLSMLWSNGEDVFAEDYRPSFNSAEGVEATELYADYLQEDNMTASSSVAWGEAEASEEFVQGRAASYMNWYWRYPLMIGPDTSDDIANNVGFAPMPSWEGKESQPYASSWTTSILESSENQDAAWEFLQWLSNEDTEKQAALRDGDSAVETNVVNHKSNLEDPEVNEKWNGSPSTASEILENSRTVPAIPEWLEVQEILSTAINDIAGGADTEDRLNQAADEVESVMQRAGYYE